MGKGVQAERDLSDTLEDQYGYAAMRSPGSGGTTQRPRADIVAIKEMEEVWEGELMRTWTRIHWVSLKADPDGTATFPDEEVQQLLTLGERSGASSTGDGGLWLGVKPDLRSHDQWYFVPVWEANRTPEGNYSIRQADHEDALSIDEVFGPGGV